jgi:hypothetical protein
VESAATLALKAVGMAGPANVQGFVTDDGDVVIVEINPRFSGGLPIAARRGRLRRRVSARDPRRAHPSRAAHGPARRHHAPVLREVFSA